MSRKTLAASGGILLGAALLYVALSRVEWELLRQTLAALDTGVLAPAWLALVGSVLCRALRWTTLSGGDRKVFPAFWRAANIGYLGNMLLPMRAGDLLRMAAVSRMAKMPPGAAVGCAVADRTADGVTMSLFLVGVLGYHGRGWGESSAMLVLACGFLAIAMGLAGFVRFGDQASPWTGRVFGRFPWLQRVQAWYGQAFTGVQALRNRFRLFLAGLLSVGAFSLDCVMLWLLMAALGWSLPFMAAVTLAVFLATGSALPAAPGYVGVYQVAAILALDLFGVSATHAVALSILLQLLLLANFILFGGRSLLAFARSSA